MTDPTPTGSALLGIASAAGVAALGLEPAPLFWALVGATLGITFAPPATKVKAVFTFMAVVLACSLFGSFLARRYVDVDLQTISRNVYACILAIGFHPILAFMVTKWPAIGDWLLRRFGINESKP